MPDLDGTVIDLGVSAVVADPVPLLRIGLVTALRLADVVTVERCEGVDAAVDAARRLRPRLLVIGCLDGDCEALVRRAPGVDAELIALLPPPSRSELVALLGAGVAGLALRSISPEDLASMARAVLAGERCVAPALLPLLVGLEPPGAAPVAALGRVSLLTAKEQQVLAHLARGASNAAIADALYISPATVKSHLASIYSKLDVSSRHQATSRAVALGLLH